MTFDFDEYAALDAAGALAPDDELQLSRALTSAPADVRARVAALRDVTAALAELGAADAAPRPQIRAALLGRIGAPEPVPAGFTFKLDEEETWVPHVVPGIRMKLLSRNERSGYVTLLLDVAAGARFPAHRHGGDEECYVISGSLYACGRKIGAGDFHHAAGGSDHSELWTEEGCRVLLVVPPDDYLPAPGFADR
jgi:quercetin dioxygenase-like cupin family protein